MTYEKRSREEVRSSVESILDTRINNPALDDVDILGALAASFAYTVADQQEESLQNIDKQSKLETATGVDLTQKANEYGIVRRDATKATGVLEFSRDTSAPTDYTINTGTRAQTPSGNVVFETTETVTLSSGTTSVKASAQAIEGGTDGNLPANKLTVMPSPPSGISSVTNPNATGDENVTDTNGNQLIPGTDRETDAQLRERVIESTSIGGAATTGSIETALRELDGVRSVTVFPNSTDSTDANGLPPYSNEVIVAGGKNTEIAKALAQTVSVTELFRLQSGIIGQNPPNHPYSVYVSALDTHVNVDFSRPTIVIATIDMSIVTTDNYIGDDKLKDRIVEYIGGADTSGGTTPGLGAGENIFIDLLKDEIVGEDTGVKGISSLVVDTNSDNNDDRTTNADGIEVITVSNSEQIFTNADLGIQITEV